MSLESFLTELGCDDPKMTSDRFTDDMEFYTDILYQALSDPGFERLSKTLGDGDVSSAFSTAHALKGIIGNCGVTPMYNVICSIVEPLRAGHSESVMPDYLLLLKQRNEILERLEKEK